MGNELDFEALSRQDASLVVADKTIKFLYERLQRQTGEIRALLLEIWKDESLQESMRPWWTCSDAWKIPTWTRNLQISKELLERLYHLYHHEPVTEQENVAENEWPLTLKDELNNKRSAWRAWT
jgi:hypothetical protein